MAKSLGQIHTVNFYNSIDPTVAEQRILNYDVSGQLCHQLQRMVRQGNSFKLVGLDMNLTAVGTLGGGQVSGYIRYYAPTKGRCEAYRSAFHAMRNAMKLQGINMTDNEMYDFRAGFNGKGETYLNGATIQNQATMDASNPLCLTSADGEPSVFGVHNSGVIPTSQGVSSGDLFQSGFNTMGVQATPTDFVFNDRALWTGNEHTASEEWEAIPFMMSWTPDTTDIATQFQFRPDPALYLAIMTGQLQIYLEEINLDGGASQLELTSAVQISGWTSIMSDKTKKPKRRKSRKSNKRRSRK